MAMQETRSMHPDIQRALDSVMRPEVQDLIRRVSEYGLAVALPHMHGEGGDLRPLPAVKVIHESELRISFLDRDAPTVESVVPTMWRWDQELEGVRVCADCGDPGGAHPCIS